MLSTLLTATLTLPLLSCCGDPVVTVDPDPVEVRPTLPVRLGPPRASDEELRAWATARRVDLLVAEILRERRYADAMERDGDFAR